MTDVRDCMGRTLSYHLAMWPGASDTQLKRIQLRDQDWESGYNAFHLCVLSGQLRKCHGLFARSLEDPNDKGKTWQITDKAGMSPLLLLQSMILNKTENRKKPIIRKLYDESCYSRGFNFGSNVNMQLGTGDNNDRMGSWYEIDTWKMSGKDLRFKSCCMTKYYSLLLTVDRNGTNSAYITGRSTKLKLFGSRDLFRYIKFSDEELEDIKCSNHHLIAKTVHGNVLLWGSNKYGQLGLNPKNLEFSEEPNSIELSLGKQDLVSCSNIHTCVLSKSGSLQSWGLDVGQFGSTSKLKKETSYLDQKGQVTPQPVTTFLPSDIREPIALVCTDFVTFILCAGNRLLALTNYRILTVRTTPSQHDSFDKFFSRQFQHHQIVDIKCKDPYGKNLMLLYDDGTVACISDFKKSPKPQSFWRPRHSWDKCISFDTGNNGQLVIATAKGDIYSSTACGRKFVKIQDSILGGSSYRVSCDPLFASFNVLIGDDMEKDLQNILGPVAFPQFNNNYDIEVQINGNYLTSCHRAILMAAQEKLMSELITYGRIRWRDATDAVDVNLNTDDPCLWCINFSGTEDLGVYLKSCMSCYYNVSPDFSQILPCSKLQNFINAYYLPSVFTPPHPLLKSIKSILEPNFAISPNVKILLADNRECNTHSFILQAHSIVFEKQFSAVWSHNSNEYELDWSDITHDLCSTILNCIYSLTIQRKPSRISDIISLDIGHKRYHEQLLKILEISDRFLMSQLIHHVEMELISAINIDNVMMFWIAANDFCLLSLTERCEEYIFRNPSVLFNPDVKNFVAQSVTPKMWHSIENKFTTELGIHLQKSWYQTADLSHCIRQFETDIGTFNSRFMTEENSFNLLIDSINHRKTRQKSTLELRKPSFNKSAQSSHTNEHLLNIRRASTTSQSSIAWNKSFNMSDSAIDDEEVDSSFVEVSKKKKRRASSTIKPSVILDGTVHDISSNLVNNNLAGRKSSAEHTFPSIGEASNKTTAASKIKIKKETQKEKIKRMSEESNIKKISESETSKVWGKPVVKITSANNPSNSVGGKTLEIKEVPAVKLASTKFPSLHEVLKSGKKPTGIVPVSGDGTKQTMPLYASTKSSLSWTAKETTTAPSKSIQEALEEAKFLKWWKEESEKIQAQQAASEMLMGVKSENSRPKPGLRKKSSSVPSNGKNKTKHPDKTSPVNDISNNPSKLQPSRHKQAPSNGKPSKNPAKINTKAESKALHI
ncbi:unnamed protein product [Kluyveromyces dobzhanskii CBS 2104]|uniref:WGS project CCBQ000000000 data, contig 00058 n=1 Tax=Kluyveromyces dobzhanskii CBS 2104 TaxID=1427455 RepID=A0A0A8LC15_9SACH|nr:unnamed protein product [Kluyveromyces dobzhanskii CBS 2104]